MSVYSAIAMLLKGQMTLRVLTRCQSAKDWADWGHIEDAKKVMESIAEELPADRREAFLKVIDKEYPEPKKAGRRL